MRQTRLERRKSGGFGELLTARQTGDFLGVSIATVYRMLSSGRLPVEQIKIGAEMRLPRRQIERWLEGPAPVERAEDFSWDGGAQPKTSAAHARRTGRR